MMVTMAMIVMMAMTFILCQTIHLGDFHWHLVRLVRHRVLLRTDLQLLCVRHYRT